MTAKLDVMFTTAFVVLMLGQVDFVKANSCEEQPYCLTVNLTTLLHVCRNFFRVPCPYTCGVCASEKLKVKFINTIDPNSDGRISIDEAQPYLKALNISLDDALVTEIKDLILDSKAVVTDLYKLFDDDKNSLVTITELIDGHLTMLESFGVKIKSEFRESISSIGEIIRISNKGELILPKLSDLIHIVSHQLGSYPHGLMTLNRIQNMTNGYFNLERVVTTHQLDYNIDMKLFAASLLAKMDRDNDGLVGQSDYIYSIIGILKYLNATVTPKVEENLRIYFEIYHASIQSLLIKYGLSDFSLLEGKVLPEYDNKPFVNLVIPIQDSIQTTRKFIPSEIMRYIRSATNNVPQRKLTPNSIIESTYVNVDRNRDGLIDIPEFVYFAVNSLPKEMNLSDMNEALKVMKLFDENNDDKMSLRELKELLKNDFSLTD